MSDSPITKNIKSSQSNISDAWYRLTLFNYFRGSLALFFITIYLNDWLPQLVPDEHVDFKLFFIISLIYLSASLFFSASIYRRNPGLDTQVIIQTLVDIFCIVALMHATGGIRTGLGMLLIITISMTSLFFEKRVAILFAAITAIAIISEQIYSEFTYIDYSPDFTQAGLLGILIFITALLTTYITKKLKETEKLAEDTSQELETIVQMNEHIIQNMRTGIIAIKNSGQILMANNAALELFGNIAIDQQTNIKDISPDLYKRFIEWNNDTMQSQQPIQQTQGLPDIQPGFSRIDRNVNPDRKHQGRTLVFLEDATQLAQRFQQVKLASLGRLTASIAHEIRNPLAAINHAGQLLNEASEHESDKKLTSIINTQALRLNSIVENVLQLSRQQRGTPESINLHNWFQPFQEECVATHNLQSNQIQIQIIPQDIEILFVSSQLHQVMWNLCCNAINHSKKELSKLLINIQGAIDTETNQPYIDIIDNGQGIDEDILTNIFDPFFTTSSKGIGLGLYISKEVLESNRAKIRHISPPAGGTCFRIYFQQAH